MYLFHHDYSFDPCYGYQLIDLLEVRAPASPASFADYWRRRYVQTMTQAADFTLSAQGEYAGYQVFDIQYRSTRDVKINGWLLIPKNGEVRQAIVVGHGYGGREQPDYHLDIPGAALLFPCFRGLGRSPLPGVSSDPRQHVLHGIEHPDSYILGGCVEDVWMAVGVLLKKFPQTAGRIGYMGISFSGGIGALAVPWDTRIKRAHFNVPTFGYQQLRLTLPTVGSAAALQDYTQHGHNAVDTLKLYDAAFAAVYAWQPAHFALAEFDPVVAPPGQFAIHNAWAGKKQLFVLEAGHFDYPNRITQEQQLLTELRNFFGS